MPPATLRTWLELDASALASNLEALRGLLRATPSTRLCAVMKANAYGHGLRELAPLVAAHADMIALDSLDEAQLVRSVAPHSDILLLGYTPRCRLPEVVALGLEVTIYDLASLAALDAAAQQQSRQVRVHLKIETGTGRQGLQTEQLSGFLAQFAASDRLDLAGLSTHFADLEEHPDSKFASEQFQRLQAALAEVRLAGFAPQAVHGACSAALLLRPDVHASMVRVGIAQYGVWPSAAIEAAARAKHPRLRLRPVLRWQTRIAQLKRCRAGTTVGYGRACKLTRDTRVAVLPVGYADGFDRSLSSRGQVLIDGQACPILGRVCMNMTMVDASGVDQPEVEQAVVLLGRSGSAEISAATLAAWADTIPYELLARIAPGLPRVMLEP